MSGIKHPKPVSYTHLDVYKRQASGCYKKSGIKNCQNSGNITAQGSYGGGIVGELINGLVYFCENTGDVNGENYAGGIVGRNYSSTVLGESAVDFSNRCV